jgi:hypothetical protein
MSVPIWTCRDPDYPEAQVRVIVLDAPDAKGDVTVEERPDEQVSTVKVRRWRRPLKGMRRVR